MRSELLNSKLVTSTCARLAVSIEVTLTQAHQKVDQVYAALTTFSSPQQVTKDANQVATLSRCPMKTQANRSSK